VRRSGRAWTAVYLGLLGSPVIAQVPSFDINCAIRPIQVVEVAAPVDGIVSAVSVRPGAKVAEGDIIAEFDADFANAALLTAELRASSTAGRDAAASQFASLQDKVARLETAVSRRVVSQSELEAARLEMAVAEGTLNRENELLRLAAREVEDAKTALSKTVVRSPVSGQLGEELIDVGESPRGRPVAIIYVTDPMRVEAYVPTALLADFLARERFEIIVNGNRENPVAVDLDYISQVADLSSNTQSVYFTLKATDILPGYQCLIPAASN
jgi:RND family efflux transporter MFP subunit